MRGSSKGGRPWFLGGGPVSMASFGARGGEGRRETEAQRRGEDEGGAGSQRGDAARVGIEVGSFCKTGSERRDGRTARSGPGNRVRSAAAGPGGWGFPAGMVAEGKAAAGARVVRCGGRRRGRRDDGM